MRDELGPDVEVETHIEPLPADVLPGRDASAARIGEDAATRYRRLPPRSPTSPRSTTCACARRPMARSSISIAASIRHFRSAAVHDLVDAVERRLRQRFPPSKRVIGHAEPGR